MEHYCSCHLLVTRFFVDLVLDCHIINDILAVPSHNILPDLLVEFFVCVAADQPKPQFYIYCKNPCKGLKPGKLRVRCADCKQSTFLLDQEPGGWEDVLKPRTIRGRCESQDCSGVHAVSMLLSLSFCLSLVSFPQVLHPSLGFVACL